MGKIDFKKYDEKALESMKVVARNKNEIFGNFLSVMADNFVAGSIVRYKLNYYDMFDNVDPNNLDAEYILNNIAKYKTPAWRFYEYLFMIGELDEEWAFLCFTANYGFIDEMIKRKLKPHNIVYQFTKGRNGQGYTNDRVIFNLKSCVKENETDVQILANLDRVRELKRDDFATNFVLVNCPDKEINNYCTHYLTKTIKDQTSPLLAEFITNFMYENNIKSSEDFSDELIEKCLEKTYEVCPNNNRLFYNVTYLLVDILRELPENEQPLLYNVNTLKNGRMYDFFKEGYRPVLFNRYEPVPTINKMILLPNGEEQKVISIPRNKIKYIDFESNNDKLSSIVKEHFWNDTSNAITTKISYVRHSIEFINMFYTKKDNVKEIKLINCAKYISKIKTNVNTKGTIEGRMSSLRWFLRYLQKNTDIVVRDSCIDLFTNKRKRAERLSRQEIVPKDDLDKICEYVNSIRNETFENKMYSTMFYINLLTDYRPSEIASFERDSIYESSIKKGEFGIRCLTKVSGGKPSKQIIPKNLKTLIEEYLDEQDQYISDYPESLKNLMFVRKEARSGRSENSVYEQVTQQNYNSFITKVCKESGVAHYTADNFKSTYITNVKRYIDLEKVSDLYLLPLTNHKSRRVLEEHYFDQNKISAFEYTRKITIGDVDLKGKILKETTGYDVSKENEIDDGCGFCSEETCKEFALAGTCIGCNCFVSFPQNLPAIKRKISEIDRILNSSQVKAHDKEDLIKLKAKYARVEFMLEELINNAEVLH